MEVLGATYADEESPNTSPSVDEVACFAQVPRTRLKLSEHDLAKDWNAC